MEIGKDLKTAYQIQLPPGFRFHPSDEELIVHYLSKKTTNDSLPAAIFAEVELYKFNPWDLPKKALFGEEEWYFFTPRDRKYPNGMRPNRMASSGYWKATGTDKPILSSCGSKVIGIKKALVFYIGRPPKGNKTDWIMQEYRLPEATYNLRKERTMRLDDWVLCRVRQKTGMPGNFWGNRNGASKEPAQLHPKSGKQWPVGAITAPVVGMFREHSYKDYSMLPFLSGFQNPRMDAAAVSNICFEGNKISTQTLCMDTTTLTSSTAVSNISFEEKKTTSSSVCEDNFNINYLQNSVPHFSNNLLDVRKRKIIDGNSEDISFRQLNKKTSYWLQNSASNDTTGAVSCCASKVDKNNSFSSLDELGSMNMMYQDLYSLTFT